MWKNTIKVQCQNIRTVRGTCMKRYTKEFREETPTLSDNIGVKKTAEQLGVIYGTLAD
jgi:hypothetical protein